MPAPPHRWGLSRWPGPAGGCSAPHQPVLCLPAPHPGARRPPAALQPHAQVPAPPAAALPCPPAWRTPAPSPSPLWRPGFSTDLWSEGTPPQPCCTPRLTLRAPELVGLFAVDVALQLRELGTGWLSCSAGGPLTSSPPVPPHAMPCHPPHPIPTSFPRSCLMTSWMRTSASVLKSCRNLRFRSGPVFSATRSWKSGCSRRHSRAISAAFSETPTRAWSSPAMARAGAGGHGAEGTWHWGDVASHLLPGPTTQPSGFGVWAAPGWGPGYSDLTQCQRPQLRCGDMDVGM